MIQNVGQREQQEREEEKKTSFFPINNVSLFLSLLACLFARFIATFVFVCELLFSCSLGFIN